MSVGTARYIAVCGGIASGKTTLARALSDAGQKAIYEDFSSNPFWALFYEDPHLHAFETEVTFMLQHYSAIKTALAAGVNFVADFSLIQDEAYANLNLTSHQLIAFRSLYSTISVETARPVLLVHLTCGAQCELDRIKRRARPEESSISLAYLAGINDSIGRCIKTAATENKILTIDSESNDFAYNEVTRSAVVARVLSAIEASPRN